MRIETKYKNQFTGEVTTFVTHRADTLNEKGYKFKTNNSQCRVFADSDLPEEFSVADTGRIYLMVKQHLEKDTNCLIKRSKHGNRHMAESDIWAALGLQERQAKALMFKMLDKGVLAKMDITSKNITVTQYYINPTYFIAGSRVSPSLYRMFSAWLDKDVPKWAQDQLRAMK